MRGKIRIPGRIYWYALIPVAFSNVVLLATCYDVLGWSVSEFLYLLFLGTIAFFFFWTKVISKIAGEKA